MEADMSSSEEYFCVCRIVDENMDKLAHAEGMRHSDTRAALLNDTKWGPGAVVNVRFLEGAPELQERVKKAALEWMRFANVTLNFVDQGDAEIRIAFQPGKGSWSYLGTQCQGIPKDEPTMNYGWLTPASTDDEVRRVVLHEFGHALGLIHEHQNPRGPIHWNRDAVKRDLGGPPNFWDDATIENNIFKRYERRATSGTPVDPLSIMMYPIPKSWTRNGEFSAGLNSELSQTDKNFIAAAYPK
jgi:hypothetical protein